MNFDVDFGIVALDAGTENSESCGANGLPVTPCSVTMVGVYKSLIEPVEHDNLVQYVDCFRGKHEKIYVVCENYTQMSGEESVDTIVEQLLFGLYELHYNLNMTHGNLTPSCIVKSKKHYKWLHWAISTLTENGKHLDADSLLPCDLRFMSPERCAHVTRLPPKKSDVWSFGLIVAQMVCSSVKLPENPVVLAQCESSAEVLRKIGFSPTVEKWKTFLLGALEPQISKRFSVKQIFDALSLKPIRSPTDQLNSYIRFDKLSLTTEPTSPLDTKDIYYLLSLANPGCKESAIKGNSSLENGPPILHLPLNILLSPQSTLVQSPSLTSCSTFAFIPKTVQTLSTAEFKSRIEQLPDQNIFFPLIFCQIDDTELLTESQLPLVIRENDFAYQCERVSLFKALTEGSPHVREQLLGVARNDINPLYRAETWASILNVTWSQLLAYETIDKIATTPTDRQISVDIPRCHQYNDLLASPSGHIKLTRVLKAWLRHNEDIGYVYWQGLDSLAAPFVILNFGNEAMAFACFNAFIHKYLRDFFKKDNSVTIQEYLALFSHLLAFHDPKLFNHLDELGFNPELYAIPWFLTMFTHVLPLHKTIHVWDTLLLGDESFPLCIGVSILLQLRPQLINYSFNDCILIFSDLPELNIERCVKEAVRIFDSTPKSIIKRDLVPLDQLRAEIAPRISMGDLQELLTFPNTGEGVVILDMRSAEHLKAYGNIREALIGNGSKGNIRESLSTGHKLLVIINDLPFADELVRDCIPNVCSLIWNEVVPHELRDLI
ncbi:TBC domain-containing protein kinase-like protein [Halotydeus destructor]|nr:TBC domain-containing protein kinase-like protein [Halotydeus destructor]